MTITGSKKKQIAVITGGGDAPGTNAVIRGIVAKAKSLGYDVLGFKLGWKGLIENTPHGALDLDSIENIHMTGGTILGSSRTNPYKEENGEKRVIETLEKNNCDYVIAIGGDDTLGAALKLSKAGVKVVGIPKTIDNDLNGTDCTFGFDTAVNKAMKQIEDLHTTAKSHNRVMLVEIMGRHAGWLALYAGLAGGAHHIVLTEEPLDIGAICKKIERRKKQGKLYTVVAVAESATPIGGKWVTKNKEKDEFGNVFFGGVTQKLRREIEDRTGIETRYMILGHTQRSGNPSGFDRVFGLRLGVKGVEMIENKEFGKMAALKGSKIEAIPLENAVKKTRTVPSERIEEMKLIIG